jgi:hypothetical protein
LGVPEASGAKPGDSALRQWIAGKIARNRLVLSEDGLGKEKHEESHDRGVTGHPDLLHVIM